jgi:hypothetical protein
MARLHRAFTSTEAAAILARREGPLVSWNRPVESAFRGFTAMKDKEPTVLRMALEASRWSDEETARHLNRLREALERARKAQTEPPAKR